MNCHYIGLERERFISKQPIDSGHNEEEQLKHIKAVYAYNHMNGYSKLSTYAENNWESISNEVDIK